MAAVREESMPPKANDGLPEAVFADVVPRPQHQCLVDFGDPLQGRGQVGREIPVQG